ncbi:hypothetical protein BCD49_18245 [Pseudofrankia sp. EUN1h]|nr:hypothetical protein BCD49_18245 [Pseudofrankia sp. EUN1h]
MLSSGAVRDFVGPGTSSDLLNGLYRAQVRKRILQLAFVARRLRSDAPELAERSGFLAAYEMLKECPAEQVSLAAGYPSFGRWCDLAETFVISRSHVNLPDGQVASHLRLLGSFALSATARHRGGRLTLAFDHDGRICLPGLGIVVEAPREYAGSKVTCSVSPGGRFDVELPDGPAISVESPRDTMAGPRPAGVCVRELERLAGRLELNDVDPLLRTGFPSHDFERLTDEAARRWLSAAGDAVALLHRVLPAGAAEVSEYIQVLVPLVSQSPTIHRSAATAETFGMVQMSWSGAPFQLAEALLHEYYHNKLNALLDIDPLVVGQAEHSRCYSPWRDDARPLHGLLHAVFSFYSVVVFWAACAAVDPSAAGQDRAVREFARRREQVRTGVDQLLEHAQLTEVGKTLLGELLTRLDDLPEITVPPEVARAVRGELLEHRARWLERHDQPRHETDSRLGRLAQRWAHAGGKRRPSSGACPSALQDSLVLAGLPAPTQPMTSADKVALEACQLLGLPTVIPTNRLADHAGRRDPTLDLLGRLSVVEPAEFARLASSLREADGEDGVIWLLTGHLAYVERRYAHAAERYARCLDGAPDNVDLWRDLAFALRHLGFREEADTALFNLALVVAFTSAHVTDRSTLAGLGVRRSPDDDALGNESVATYLLLLRWIGCETR